MRTPKLATPPIIKAQPDPEMITQERTYKVITALYGGGVEPGEADDITVVRVPEIRGQLRFWWRACRGATENGTIAEMRQQEDKIWGSAASEKRAGESRVTVTLTEYTEGQLVSFEEQRIPKYASFPLREKRGSVRIGVTFSLTLTYPVKIENDVNAALWAWETFGGLGARTRRGFGAIHCQKCIRNGVSIPLVASATVTALKGSILDGLKRHVVDSGSWHPSVPHLTRTSRVKVSENVYNDSFDAWKTVIRKLQEFRQQRIAPMKRGYWPEPDAIRRLTGQTSSSHSTPISSVEKFPRAEMGLPIIFHFRIDGHRHGDPEDDTILEGSDFDRLASPLLLRPYALSTNKAVAIAVVLTIDPAFGTSDKPVVLRDQATHNVLATVDTKLNASDVAKLKSAGMRFIEQDIFDAFLKSAF